MKDTPNTDASLPPILRDKIAAARSEFTPENLLREARRQKAITVDNVPEVCILDPDGDIVRHLIASNSVTPDGPVTTRTSIHSLTRE